MLPHERARYEAACQHLDSSFGAGIYSCPNMREALDPWLSPELKQPPSTDLIAVPEGVIAVTPSPTDHEAVTPEPDIPSPQALASSLHSQSLQAIMAQFQSLGDNCELGLIQRWADTEPLDLLRFAGFSIPVERRLQRTIEALTDGFSGLGAEESVVCELHGTDHPRQFMVRETRWQILYHTESYDGEIEPEVLRLQQVKALQFRRRKLLEDMESAHRVFVWKSNLPILESDVRALVACLRRYGPNLLLWVSVADDEHATGQVEYAGGGLLKGYVSRFAPYTAAGDIEFSSWHAVCRNAAAAADFLRRCGEWSRPDADMLPLEKPNAEPPLGEIPIEQAASALYWEERRSDAVAVGPVYIGSSFRETQTSEWFQQNPGSQDVRGALLLDIVMDSARSVLLQASRKIPETRYGLEDEEDYKKIRAMLPGLRFVETDKVAIIGFNRSFRNFYHWMMQSVPTLDLSVRRVGAERCALVLPHLAPWQEETLSMLGLGEVPRISINLSHHYHFPLAYFCEYLNNRTSFFLSPRSLEVFDRLAMGVEPSYNGPELLYVARTDATNRMVTNEEEVERLMAIYGFVSIVPGSLSLREQVRLFKGARIVAGPHGSGLTNIAFCNPGTKVLELVQSSYANPCMNRIAQARRLEYHAECFESAISPDVHKQSWSVDLERLTAKVVALLR